MTVRMVHEPHPVRRDKPLGKTVELNPHSLTIIGTQPLVTCLIDCGTDTYIMKLPTDLQVYAHRKLGEKLGVTA